MYEPKYLKKWTLPANYAGAHWDDYYGSGFGRSRDSDVLEISNFETAKKALAPFMRLFIKPNPDCDNELAAVQVVTESHWAAGWVEWIAIHQGCEEALKIADELRERYEGYPVLDESDYSEREWEDACLVWRSCYSVKERYELLKEYGSNPLHARFEDFGKVHDPSGRLFERLTTP